MNGPQRLVAAEFVETKHTPDNVLQPLLPSTFLEIVISTEALRFHCETQWIDRSISLSPVFILIRETWPA
jgi:hypothetical protein